MFLLYNFEPFGCLVYKNHRHVRELLVNGVNSKNEPMIGVRVESHMKKSSRDTKLFDVRLNN